MSRHDFIVSYHGNVQYLLSLYDVWKNRSMTGNALTPTDSRQFAVQLQQQQPSYDVAQWRGRVVDSRRSRITRNILTVCMQVVFTSANELTIDEKEMNDCIK